MPINPNILQQVFGRGGTIDSQPQNSRERLIAMLAGIGSGFSQASAQPGANLGQGFAAGAQGMLQGQQQAQALQMNRAAMEQAQAKAELDRERRQRIMELLGAGQGRNPGFITEVDARLPAFPSAGPAQPSPFQDQNVGILARQFESGDGGVGTISSGQGDPGGVSYGEFQLASDTGTMDAFLQSPEGRPFAAQFGDLQPGTPQFNQVYREVAQGANDNFAQAQRQFIERTHFRPVMEMAEQAGLNTNSRAVQEALFSQGVQHSGRGNAQIIQDAAAQLGPGATPEDTLRALFDARGRYASQFAGPAATTDRYSAELDQTLGLLGQPPAQAPVLNGYQQRALQAQQQQGAGGLPPQMAQLLSIMEPERAAELLARQQLQGPGEQPAAVREALFAAGGDEALARRLMLADMTAPNEESALVEKIRLFQEANPDATRAEAINAVQGKRTSIVVDPLQGAMRVDRISGEATPIRPEFGPVEFDPERDVPNLDIEAAEALGVPGAIKNMGNMIAGFFNADRLPAPEAETARAYINNLSSRATAAFAMQLRGRDSNMQLEIGERLQVRPGQPTMSVARAKEQFDANIRDMKAELKRINEDILDQPGFTSKEYNNARANASQIRRLLGEMVAVRRTLDDTPTQNMGEQGRRPGPNVGPAPEGWEDDWDILTEKERQRILEIRGIN